MLRVSQSRSVVSWAFLPLLVIGLLAARPASAYVGNYKALYWSAYRHTALGHFSKAASRYRGGLKEQRKWWDKLESTIRKVEDGRGEGTFRRDKAAAMELEYLKLRTEVHEGLERQVEAEIAELGKPDGGLVGATVEQRRLVYPFEKEGIMLEVEAARTEQNGFDFASARELWVQAIDARKRGADAISAALNESNAATEATPATEATDARIAYLEQELERFTTLAANLQAELDWSADPMNVLGRMSYFEVKTTFYSGLYEKVYRDLAGLYRAKAAYACDLVAAADAARADEMADLKDKILNKREDAPEAVVPTWYYPVEYELPLYEFGFGAPEEFGSLSELD